MRQTPIARKNPINYKMGQGMFSEQLKHLLRKDQLHKMVWDPLPMYNPRKLAHTEKEIDHYTYQEKHNPHNTMAADNGKVYEVPDQQYRKVAVPSKYKDAYWWRERQAKRVQVPVEMVQDRMYNPEKRWQTDFQDLSFKQKFTFTEEEVIAHMKKSRR